MKSEIVRTRGGRPTRCTPELSAAIAALVREGVFLQPAARSLGVPPRTLYDWLRRGEEGRTPFSQFSQLVRRAEAEAQVRVEQMVVGQIPRNASAGLHWLAVHAPERWTRRERFEFSGPSGGPIEVDDFRKRIIEETDRVAERLLETMTVRKEDVSE